MVVQLKHMNSHLMAQHCQQAPIVDSAESAKHLVTSQVVFGPVDSQDLAYESLDCRGRHQQNVLCECPLTSLR